MLLVSKDSMLNAARGQDEDLSTSQFTPHLTTLLVAENRLPAGRHALDISVRPIPGLVGL